MEEVFPGMKKYMKEEVKKYEGSIGQLAAYFFKKLENKL